MSLILEGQMALTERKPFVKAWIEEPAFIASDESGISPFEDGVFSLPIEASLAQPLIDDTSDVFDVPLVSVMPVMKPEEQVAPLIAAHQKQITSSWLTTGSQQSDRVNFNAPSFSAPSLSSVITDNEQISQDRTGTAFQAITLSKLDLVGAMNNPQSNTLMFTQPETFNLASSVANQVIENPSQKNVQWAKVDLTSVLNNLQNKTLASSQIGEKLNTILQDRINIQASNNIKTAQIRLDPPDLGHIRLHVSLEGDRVNVNIGVQNAMVREALIQTSDKLRHELVNQNFLNVSVDIHSEGQQESKGQQQKQQQINQNHLDTNNTSTARGQDEFIVKV